MRDGGRKSKVQRQEKSFFDIASNFCKLGFNNSIALITKKADLINLVFITRKIGLISPKCIAKEASFIDSSLLPGQEISYTIAIFICRINT